MPRLHAHCAALPAQQPGLQLPLRRTCGPRPTTRVPQDGEEGCSLGVASGPSLSGAESGAARSGHWALSARRNAQPAHRQQQLLSQRSTALPAQHTTHSGEGPPVGGGGAATACLAGVAALGLCCLWPAAAHAAESAPAGFLELVLSTVEELGPLGPVAFVAAVAVCECIPLFPTQPLSLASGLLFGAGLGALTMLCGTTLAAATAFGISRTFGRALAERLAQGELQGAAGEAGGGGGHGSGLQVQLAKVQAAIESGGFGRQALAIFLLRLTPVPFSASNYLLGLTPLPLAPYMLGTVSCMALWSCFYASLGGASRVLLRRGADLDVLLADLLSRASDASEGLAFLGCLAAVAAGAYLGRGTLRRLASIDLLSSMSDDDGLAGGERAPDGGSGSGGSSGGAPTRRQQELVEK